MHSPVLSPELFSRSLPALLLLLCVFLSAQPQPSKGLLDPAAMARLAMGEALTNLCWAAATKLSDIKASVNWMYAAKMKSEGAAMYEAAIALRYVLDFFVTRVEGFCDKG
jgi:hypothetical protein